MRGARVIFKGLLEGGVAEEAQGLPEIFAQPLRQIRGEAPEVAVGNKGGEVGVGLAAHGFLDPAEALDENAGVVIAVDVLPDVFDELRKRKRGLGGIGQVEVGDSPEIADEGAVEAVEDDELGFVDLIAAAGPAPEHLLPEDAALYRAHEDDELQRGDVHAGREHVHRDHDLWVGAVAELADTLERAIDVGVAGDLDHEVVALREDVAAGAHELIGVGGVGHVVDRENEDF